MDSIRLLERTCGCIYVRALSRLGVISPPGRVAEENGCRRPRKATPQEEVRTPQGYSLDVLQDGVVSEGGFDVAVEVDGPSHFWGRTPTCATALKRRQLRAAGWVLLPVPYWEWDALGSSKAAKEEYLRAAILGLSEAPH
jgi:hypothetical protein